MSAEQPDTVEPMEAEFDVVASWTQEAVEQLGPEFAIPAGCRGTGSPSAFAWLAEALEIEPGVRVLDSGAGVGGPGAWLRERYGVTPVLAEPMFGAARASAALFRLPSVVAWSEHLPFASGSFDAIWSLGVLCTVPDKQAFLAEARRLLAAGGRLGLLVYVKTPDPLPEQPEGNDFPTDDELTALLDAAGFRIVQRTEAAGLGKAPRSWTTRLHEVEQWVREHHGDTDAWREADEQSGVIGRLIADGHVRSVLVHAAVR
jgi:SAM-dependent methyltransferase